jgi:hypothetical protein
MIRIRDVLAPQMHIKIKSGIRIRIETNVNPQNWFITRSFLKSTTPRTVTETPLSKRRHLERSQIDAIHKFLVSWGSHILDIH